MLKKFAFAALALATVTGSSYAHAAPQDIILANDSGETITEAHFSPTDVPVIGPDLLPGVLVDGYAKMISFPSGISECVWDMTVIFDDGSGAMGTYNLCRAPMITVR
jgi:hypothetical protein